MKGNEMEKYEAVEQSCWGTKIFLVGKFSKTLDKDPVIWYYIINNNQTMKGEDER